VFVTKEKNGQTSSEKIFNSEGKSWVGFAYFEININRNALIQLEFGEFYKKL
jgi:hypothetical protein